MKTLLRIGIGLCLVLVVQVPVLADELKFDGNVLLKSCEEFVEQFVKEKPVNYLIVGWCWGYMDAKVEIENGDLWCAPVGATDDHVARVIVKFLQNNPQRLHEPARLLFTDSLRKAWPCKGKAK